MLNVKIFWEKTLAILFLLVTHKRSIKLYSMRWQIFVECKWCCQTCHYEMSLIQGNFLHHISSPITQELLTVRKQSSKFWCKRIHKLILIIKYCRLLICSRGSSLLNCKKYFLASLWFYLFDRHRNEEVPSAKSD